MIEFSSGYLFLLLFTIVSSEGRYTLINMFTLFKHWTFPCQVNLLSALRQCWILFVNDLIQILLILAHEWVTTLFGHEWHIFDNETRQLVIVFII